MPKSGTRLLRPADSQLTPVPAPTQVSKSFLKSVPKFASKPALQSTQDQTAVMESPIGPLLLESDGTALTAIRFATHRGRQLELPDRVVLDQVLREAIRQLREYFAGRRRVFELPLRPAGTEFQRKTWAELLEIPYGETISYAELARRVGKPRAARAVGAANGANPISLVVPCHRVIASGGGLGGYGGGLEIKRRLLELEGAL